jgi:hypothetical protein
MSNFIGKDSTHVPPGQPNVVSDLLLGVAHVTSVVFFHRKGNNVLTVLLSRSSHVSDDLADPA